LGERGSLYFFSGATVVEENALCLTMFEPCDVVWFPSPLSEDGVAATHKSQGFESGQPNREVLLLCSHKTPYLFRRGAKDAGGGG
jgi:hypothetical protein